ncbi:MAG: hypothetical protein HY700_00130 [Gemmatimonadetes bacterium]|nr:hypothetical protein [Gemmatimonadota bacterium]
MSNSARALLLLTGGTLALLFAGAGCVERLADCVEVYPGSGATRLPGYTMAACEEHCKSVQGTIDCYWDGSIAALTGPSVSVPTGRRTERP